MLTWTPVPRGVPRGRIIEGTQIAGVNANAPKLIRECLDL